MEIEIQSDSPPEILSPEDFRKETWQAYLRFIWPILIEQFPRERFLPYKETGAPVPREISELEKARENLDRIKDPILRKILADTLAKAETHPRSDPEPLEDDLPPEPEETPPLEPEKRKRKGEVIPLHKRAREKPEELTPEPLTVGVKLKLRWIPGEFWESRAFAGLVLGARELYRILFTFSKQAGLGSRYRYCQIGVKQARDLLERRKEDLLRIKRGEGKKEVSRIGETTRSVERYLEALKKRALIIQIVRGRPAYSLKSRGPYVSKYLVVVSERQRFKLIMDRKKGLGPRSRRYRGRPQNLP